MLEDMVQPCGPPPPQKKKGEFWVKLIIINELNIKTYLNKAIQI
jgi:hypothetical protein